MHCLDTLGKWGIHPLLKMIATLRILSYGVVADFNEKYLQLSSILVCNLANYSYAGIGELITSCKVGDATKSKLRRVAEWTLHTKRALGESHQQVRSAETILHCNCCMR